MRTDRDEPSENHGIFEAAVEVVSEGMVGPVDE
jgi:hypothetical protein